MRAGESGQSKIYGVRSIRNSILRARARSAGRFGFDRKMSPKEALKIKTEMKRNGSNQSITKTETKTQETIQLNSTQNHCYKSAQKSLQKRPA